MDRGLRSHRWDTSKGPDTASLQCSYSRDTCLILERESSGNAGSRGQSLNVEEPAETLPCSEARKRNLET
jgi:hypothetical protein